MNVSDRTLNFQTNGSPVFIILQAPNAVAPVVSAPAQQPQPVRNEPAGNINWVAQRKSRRQDNATSASTSRSTPKTRRGSGVPSDTSSRFLTLMMKPRENLSDVRDRTEGGGRDRVEWNGAKVPGALTSKGAVQSMTNLMPFPAAMPKYKLTITPDSDGDDNMSRGLTLESNQAPVVVVVNMTTPPKTQKPKVFEIPDSDDEQANMADKRTRANEKTATGDTATAPSSRSAEAASNSAQPAGTVHSTTVASTSTAERPQANGDILAVAAGASSASTNACVEGTVVTDAATEVEDTEEEELKPPPKKILRCASQRRREKERERLMDQRSYIYWH
ncbi:hypothetical protein K474DRAFT_1680418 [Panus rudis PR-1116 ss-1]|nr:hypothetical protein K474DRAFT_1680418 [Panus rudis PR-1116 ss-1]